MDSFVHIHKYVWIWKYIWIYIHIYIDIYIRYFSSSSSSSCASYSVNILNAKQDYREREIKTKGDKGRRGGMERNDMPMEFPAAKTSMRIIYLFITYAWIRTRSPVGDSREENAKVMPGLWLQIKIGRQTFGLRREIRWLHDEFFYSYHEWDSW